MSEGSEETHYPRRASARARFALAAGLLVLLGVALAAAGPVWLAEEAGLGRWALMAVLFLLGLAHVVVGVVLWIARSQVYLVHPNGIAVESAGRLRQRIFWRDLTNVIEDPGTGAFELYARRVDLSKVPPGGAPTESAPHAVHEHLSVHPRSLEHGDELRARIRSEWDNVWGQKMSTSSEVAFFYGPLVKREAAERAALTGGVSVALGVVLAGLAVTWMVVVTREAARADLPWRGGLVGGTALVFFLEIAAGRAWLRHRETAGRIGGVGGLQFGDDGLKVFSEKGELREIPFAEMTGIDPGPPIEIRLRSGGPFLIHRELAWFDKFRDWLLDDAKARGVPVLPGPPSTAPSPGTST
ncbi:MAG: hypothetical protein HYY93_09775 [Planctomycetes bacterium]|nr:hypothetical protein [Planctomycetota bacterium]